MVSDVDEVKGYINKIKNGSPEGTPTPSPERTYSETSNFGNFSLSHFEIKLKNILTTGIFSL